MQISLWKTAAFLLAFCWMLGLAGAKPASATTYYLAPASQGGNDGNNGLSSNRPWLSPNHSLNCGDVILAEPSTAYNSNNFNSGHWGWVNCPSGNNVAWLQCEQFDACKIWSSAEGIYVDHPYWGVQGWEVTVESGAIGFCFGVAPSGNYPYAVHHVLFANNVANGCQAGGIVTFNYGNQASADYVGIIGNIVYNGAQGGRTCATGISVYQPMQSDWAAGTHIFVAGNFTYANYQGDPCNGHQPYGGDGIILDTFDGTDSHMPYPYGAQAVVENNISVGNGGMGLELQNNVAGSYHALIYAIHNTVADNEKESWQSSNSVCSESMINSAYNVREYGNLVAADAATACANNPVYAFRLYTVDGTDWVYSNFLFGDNGQNEAAWGITNNGTFGFGSNVQGQNPYFRNASVPSAPYCSGTSSTTDCMSGTISNFTPTNSAANGYGYQWPSTTWSYDPLFPQWVCNTNLPQGLVTMGC